MNNADAAITVLRTRPVTAWELLQEVGTLGTKDAASQLLARLWQQRRLKRKKVPNMDPDKGLTSQSESEVYQYTLINDTEQQETEQRAVTYLLLSSDWPGALSRYLSLGDALTEAERYMNEEKGTDVMVCQVLKEAKRQVVWE